MKKVKVKLNSSSIDKAIKILEKFKKDIEEKSKLLVQELAREGMEIASIKFANAQYDGTNDVEVEWRSIDDHKSAVIAAGNAVLFIEFGTGINYPNDHPDPIATNYPHGEYGHKLGRRPNGWRYKGDPGTNGEPDPTHPGYVKTKGNPANASLYNTERELEMRFEEIVRRVFNG